MTPFELETHFITKLAALPKDKSIMGALVIVAYPDASAVVRLGDTIEPLPAILQVFAGICMERGYSVEEAGDAMKHGLIQVMKNHKIQMAKKNDDTIPH